MFYVLPLVCVVLPVPTTMFQFEFLSMRFGVGQAITIARLQDWPLALEKNSKFPLQY